MSKEDVVAAQVAAIQQGEMDVLKAGIGAAFDAGMAEGQPAPAPAPGGFTQDDIDAAVKAAVDPLQAQVAADADALKAAQDAGSAALADLQAKFDDMAKKEQFEESLVVGLQGSIAQVQQALDAIKAVVFPPAPEPTPAA